MGIKILHTNSCDLIPMEYNDSIWLYDLFSQLKDINSLEGLDLFCKSISDTEAFISKFNIMADWNKGFLWSIKIKDKPIGFLLIYDIKENPFYSYGLFSAYRHKGYFHGILDRCNTFLESI